MNPTAQPGDGRGMWWLPDRWGFACDYVPARPDKVAVNWKRRVADPATDTSRPRPAWRAWAVVPRPGFAVIDCDKGDGHGPDGWAALQAAAGAYGGAGLPRTYVVRTPSGGAHLYYAAPPALRGRLLDTVHPQGIPIDMRAEGKGYVIGAGSVTAGGVYTLVDVPGSAPVPAMPPALCAWLDAHGYVRHAAAPRPATRHTFPRQDQAQGAPDMTPIPEGQRNDTLYRWAFGRLKNHPGNERQIHAQLLQRGALSGLGERELETIWASVVKGVTGM